MTGKLLIAFHVPGIPRPEPRARTRKGGGGVYRDKSADDWKHEVRRRTAEKFTPTKWRTLSIEPIKQSRPVSFRDTPFHLDIEFVMPRPKAHWGVGRRAGILRPSATQWHLGVPDIDNLAKAVMDALGPFCGLPKLVWWDDSQVVSLSAKKRFVAQGENPGAEIRIYLATGGIGNGDEKSEIPVG